MYTENERIDPVNIEDEMKRAYIDYSMSVIIGRALPDARDGLKPGNRRILYAMRERGWTHSKAFVKVSVLYLRGNGWRGGHYRQFSVTCFDAIFKLFVALWCT